MNFITRNFPNAITCINLIAGCVAIWFAGKADAPFAGLPAYGWAYIFIGIAAVADFFDGFAARWLRAYSNLGKELDSLCDLVSFGVAPALVALSCFHTAGVGWTSWAVLLVPVGGALRLARFNIDNRQTTTFIGLPIPANAIFWIGFTSLLYTYPEYISDAPWSGLICIGVSIIMAWAMVSNIRFFSLKFKTWGWRGNERRWMLVAAAVVFCFCLGVSGLFWLILFYGALSLMPSGK